MKGSLHAEKKNERAVSTANARRPTSKTKKKQQRQEKAKKKSVVFPSFQRAQESTPNSGLERDANTAVPTGIVVRSRAGLHSFCVPRAKGESERARASESESERERASERERERERARETCGWL